MANSSGPLGVIRQAGIAALIAGVLWLAIALFAANADPAATPECDGMRMVPGDKCIVSGGSGDSYTYESKLSDQREGKARGEQQLPYAVALTGVGAVVYTGALAGKLRTLVSR
ncbi:hypothetical protein AB0H76_17835 [Nocardia sp. NPDC050712]|uniref:hypothetical protein n=1 Tax=Nocardia sp. NPDC050712 TaxID=3155518 RepID=UPI0033DEE4A8